MCSNIRLSKSKSIKKGGTATIKNWVGLDIPNMLFGFNKGLIYNCRVDRLSRGYTQWYNETGYQRGIVEAVGFYEGGKEFTADKPFQIAVLFNKNNEFAIITEDSVGVVAKYHRRMPIILDNSIPAQQAWYIEGKIIHIDPQLIKCA